MDFFSQSCSTSHPIILGKLAQLQICQWPALKTRCWEYRYLKIPAASGSQAKNLLIERHLLNRCATIAALAAEVGVFSAPHRNTEKVIFRRYVTAGASIGWSHLERKRSSEHLLDSFEERRSLLAWACFEFEFEYTRFSNTAYLGLFKICRSALKIQFLSVSSLDKSKYSSSKNNC